MPQPNVTVEFLGPEPIDLPGIDLVLDAAYLLTDCVFDAQRGGESQTSYSDALAELADSLDTAVLILHKLRRPATGGR
jgi:hypothetical protein